MIIMMQGDTITKAQLARELGVSRAYITMIANGKRKPSQSIVDKLNRLCVNNVNNFEFEYEWGSGGRRFKSDHPDHRHETQWLGHLSRLKSQA
jgi:transcriptional regulator with XRE-family HTH domain